jgi:hypothetical protein
MTVSPPRKNASSAIPHPTSKGTPSPLDYTALYPLGNRTRKKRLLPRATPQKRSGESEKVVFYLGMSLWEEKGQVKILFRGSKARPSAGFGKIARGL